MRKSFDISMRSPRGFHSALPAADQRVSREADHDRNERPSRGRKPHGEERRGEEAAGRVHAGNAHERDRDDVMQKRDAGLSAGAEIPAEREGTPAKMQSKIYPRIYCPPAVITSASDVNSPTTGSAINCASTLTATPKQTAMHTA